MSRPVALVTGATGGIGGAIVADLARTHVVHAVGRDADRLAELERLASVQTHCVDLTDGAAVARLVGTVDRLDVLVHSAAVAGTGTLADADAAEWRRQFDINVFAPAELTRLALPLLRAAGGTVVFIGSGSGTRASAGNVVYVATKHALKGLADSLRLEEAEHGVRVTTVAPGPTDSEMQRQLQADRGNDYRPEDFIRPASVAAAVRLVVDATPDVSFSDVSARPHAGRAAH